MSNRNNAVASLNVPFIVAAVALTGCMLVVFGCVFEAQAQLDLLHSGGPAALDAYLGRVSSHQLPFAALLVESITGHCYARGAFLQGIGFWVVFALTPAVAGVASLVRWFASRVQNTGTRFRTAVFH